MQRSLTGGVTTSYHDDFLTDASGCFHGGGGIVDALVFELPVVRDIEALVSSASLAMSSLCTWQIRRLPAALIRAPNGLGSPNESMIARGRVASAISSNSGCFAMLQVMKPMPNGTVTCLSLAVACSSHAL